MSLFLGSIEGHILLLHSVCLPQVHDQVQTIQRVGTMDSPLALCFDTFTLGHTLYPFMLALARTHVHWQPILPRDVLASKFEYALHAAGFLHTAECI